MDNSAIPLTANFEPKNYWVALETAREKLKVGDPVRMANNSGCEYENNRFKVICLNHTFSISFPEGRVTYQESELQPAMPLQLIMLNYLSRADGTPLTYNFITYRDLDGGTAFYDAFFRTAIKPISDHFGMNPELLIKAAQAFGGVPFPHSTGTAVLIYLLPRVPLLYQLWAGDDEIPAQANILFDRTANHYLHTEDLATADYVSRLLIAQSQK
ncbi:MAG: DUF3786 domain-containing protein [Firmicutes bacterium]|nr:DUF3786 domain-containing protein [Bacillota bacterium]